MRSRNISHGPAPLRSRTLRNALPPRDLPRLPGIAPRSLVLSSGSRSRGFSTCCAPALFQEIRREAMRALRGARWSRARLALWVSRVSRSFAGIAGERGATNFPGMREASARPKPPSENQVLHPETHSLPSTDRLLLRTPPGRQKDMSHPRPSFVLMGNKGVKRKRHKIWCPHATTNTIPRSFGGFLPVEIGIDPQGPDESVHRCRPTL